MARLHEHHGKSILKAAGVSVPRGRAARSAAEAEVVAGELLGRGGDVVVKVQAWTTGRAAAGGVAFARTAAEAGAHAARMLGMTFGRFPVTEVLVEEKVAIARELFVSLAIDERERTPVVLIAAAGGSGIEERAAATRRIPCDVVTGPGVEAVREAVKACGVVGAEAVKVEAAVRTVFDVARAMDARSLEINPLVVTKDGSVIAADCRVTIDDYAVGRHPELGIDIARELDHPPTALERVAYRVEQEDHRGTFFFAQMNTAGGSVASTAGTTKTGDGWGERGSLIGFHGAGGGGSMMSMDAATAEGLVVANFCDTSGNPSPAKVYRAARIILSQPGLVGYFGSGSGVANQEQFWSAYGLAKAFWEMELSIPAVIRLGGNTEDRAVEILQTACAGLPGVVEGYKKFATPARIASRLAELVREQARLGKPAWRPRIARRPAFVGGKDALVFEVRGGKVWIDAVAWRERSAAIVARSGGLLRNDAGRPVLTVTPAEFVAKDSEMIACEVECRRDGIEGVFVELDVPGLEAAMTLAAALKGGA